MRLDARRRDELAKAHEGRKTARALAHIYFRTQRYRDLSASRAYRNKRDALIFVEWVECCCGNREFPTLMKPDFEEFLFQYDDRKAAQLDLRSTLNILCEEAIEAGWRPDNPVRKLSWKAPPPKEEVVLWKDEIPEQFIAMARQMRQPGLAALIEVGLFVGQRLGDLRAARHEVNYVNGALRMKQSKTGVKVSVPLPQSLRDLLESIRHPGSPFLFNDADTGTGFTVGRLHARFVEVRHALTPEGGKKMLLRTLRHSAVCRMVDAEVPLRNISAVTGHQLRRVHHIVERYAIDIEGFAEAAAKKLHRANGGSDGDFLGAEFGADRDWAGDGAAQAIYQAPSHDPQRPERLLAASIGQHRKGYTLPAHLVEWHEDGTEDAET
jgi:hypothetical protein